MKQFFGSLQKNSVKERKNSKIETYSISHIKMVSSKNDRRINQVSNLKTNIAFLENDFLIRELYLY